ncbi:MAG: 16S rRNA (adenine(1518)-N(6)/adenine(1519)-N(6))-dimethyltransferase RsmA [Bacteroidetes bacterium]|nr:16S rRNA (adenine(1518)-N(6)/adenine(1519)-N(6))-dimethyltransferase RsmA [Bacteroidota bacterium]MCL2301804.1 16S rRNA (adenine(1518)-N(6)/adenine(1519)-N(6))-dimethyltransferase RsmA [Lentimicrobiaceae bacterium]
MQKVTPKKALGQHFLNDETIAEKIVQSITLNNTSILEIGPGMGVLTQFLLQHENKDFQVVEIDAESVLYLQKKYPSLQIISGDFLKLNLSEYYTEKLTIIGNFPYNISSQILFKVLENKDIVTELVGMFQKEVAERVASKPGKKMYGILSVLLQAYYDIEYLFTVDEHLFTPPPQVKSGVIRMIRNFDKKLHCDETLFKNVVKTAFNQRRKTLRNSLKSFSFLEEYKENPIFGMRPEQLSVREFEEICLMSEL